MTDSIHSNILRRMSGQGELPSAGNPLTTSRAVRMALTKAANDSVGLGVNISSVAEHLQPLDDIIAGLDPALMLVELLSNDRLVGLVTLDTQMRAALLEMQTMGKMIAMMPEDRMPTLTDKRMCEPLLDYLLQTLPQALIGTGCDGWIGTVTLGNLIKSARASQLRLTDCQYRILRMDSAFDVADRSGALQIILPVTVTEPEPDPQDAEPVNWDELFRERIETSPATLDAILHRFDLPLGNAKDLQVGQLLPLPGCTVRSVQMVSSGGNVVAHAKLGQVGGKRAVRIEPEYRPPMSDISDHVQVDNMMSSVPADYLPSDADLMDVENIDIPGADIETAPEVTDAVNLDFSGTLGP